MNNLYFYLLLSVILYLLFTRVLENYIVSQENFDPSLVPVSSIVTLAKVAQKLVNGNGTLTNPGNLQIGASTSSPGNLTVTGTSTVSGNSTVNGNINIEAGSGNNGIIITSGNPRVEFKKTGSAGAPQLYSDGTTLHAYNAPFQADQNLTVGGATTLYSTLNLNNTSSNFLRINKGAAVDANTVNLWRTDPGVLTFVAQNAANTDYSLPGVTLDTRNSKITANTLQIDGTSTVGTLNASSANISGALGAGSANISGALGAGSANISGDLSMGGQICIGSTCINETHLKLLTGAGYFTLQNKRSSQQLLDEAYDTHAQVNGGRNNAIQSKWHFTNIGSTNDNII